MKMNTTQHGGRIGGLLAGLLALAPVASAQVVELRPNLQPFPAYAVALVPNFSTGGTTLIFSTTSWNSGLGPLELRAGETSSQGQNVYQRVYRSDGSYYDHLAGTFDWHPEHGHFHLQDYALYTLQPTTASGGSDRISSKTTFCVMDTDKVNGALAGAPAEPVYVTCDPDVQGMSVGWGDTYGRNLAGQGVDVTGLPDGDYRLVIDIDPKSRIIETNDGDNRSCTLLRLSVTRQTLTVLDANGCNSVVVSSIDARTASPGSVVPVTVKGSGFTAGMAVSFENGSGPRPVVSNTTFVDGTTYTATVTIKSGGGGRDRIWDLRVGSGVLADAFTVAR
jgi:hypothetical protein